MSRSILCGLVLLAAASRLPAATVEVVVESAGLDKTLAEKIDADLRAHATQNLDGLTEAEAGKADFRIRVRFDGSASASVPYVSTRTGELVEKANPADPGVRTGKAGFEHHIYTRLTSDGRISFTIEKNDGGTYKPVDRWTHSLGRKSEEKWMGQTPAMEQTKENKAQWKPDTKEYRNGAAQHLADWLSEQVVSASQLSLRDRFVSCTIQQSKWAGKEMTAKVSVTNKSPWPIERVTFNVVAVPPAKNNGPPGIDAVMLFGNGSAEAIPPGKTITVDFQASFPLGDVSGLPAGLPGAVNPKTATIQVKIESMKWKGN